jgi:ABC-type nitrate/sulfonate/bicarbonate transport system substrate-binding protein
MRWRARIGVWVAGALAATGPIAARADEPVPIAIASQAGRYGSLPLFIASEKGWWEAVGLKATVTIFAAASDPLAEQSWDVGAVGPMAALIGADSEGLFTVGVADDESDANVVMARPGEVDAIFKDPALLKGKTLLLQPGSTAEYAALGCLAKWRLRRADLHVVADEPVEIVAGFAQGEDRIAALSAPDSYALFENGGGITVCSGKDADAVIPGGFVARAQFAADHPALVARFLAVALHAIVWEKAHRDETIGLMRRFYQDNGVALADDDLAKEIDSRPTFTLAEQLQLLDRSKGGISTADDWYGKLAAYVVSTGAIQAPPLGASFLTDRYLKWADGDATLKGFVEGE